MIAQHIAHPSGPAAVLLGYARAETPRAALEAWAEQLGEPLKDGIIYRVVEEGLVQRFQVDQQTVTTELRQLPD